MRNETNHICSVPHYLQVYVSPPYGNSKYGILKTKHSKLIGPLGSHGQNLSHFLSIYQNEEVGPLKVKKPSARNSFLAAGRSPRQL